MNASETPKTEAGELFDAMNATPREYEAAKQALCRGRDPAEAARLVRDRATREANEVSNK